jgi:hypothetical protein
MDKKTKLTMLLAQQIHDQATEEYGLDLDSDAPEHDGEESEEMEADSELQELDFSA